MKIGMRPESPHLSDMAPEWPTPPPPHEIDRAQAGSNYSQVIRHNPVQWSLMLATRQRCAGPWTETKAF